MDPLLESYKRIIDDLDDYITKEEKRLAVLKKHLELYINEHEKAMNDIPNYLGNPLNAFTLIKRLTTDLDEIYDEIKDGTESNMRHVFINREDMMLPTMEDLSGATQALWRLQVTYQLDAHDLAEGRLNGVAYTHPMTAADCFEICKANYIMNEYDVSLAWGMETLRKYKEETNKKQSFTEVEVLEHIGFSHYKLGNVRTALEWTKKLLKVDPNYPRLPVDVRSKALTFDAASQKPAETEDGEAEPDCKSLFDDPTQKEYEALCRGQTKIKSGVAKRLFCRYMWETHPFLRLAPIKAEQVYIDPDVFVFHGVLSDDEIQVLKVLSMPRIESAKFREQETGKFMSMSYRVCKSAWFRDEESPVVARVSQRVADMTGLSMETAEQLQVVNYGIGGHYEPHYDFFVDFENAFPGNFPLNNGDRIATVLFYMSDVAQGGATVFTELGLAVFPERGAALYWRNLHPSGEGDTATRHAACPVLRGSKWVCSKWLHIVGQELINPCDLNCQQKEMGRKIPSSVLNRRGR